MLLNLKTDTKLSWLDLLPSSERVAIGLLLRDWSKDRTLKYLKSTQKRITDGNRYEAVAVIDSKFETISNHQAVTKVDAALVATAEKLLQSGISAENLGIAFCEANQNIALTISGDPLLGMTLLSESVRSIG